MPSEGKPPQKTTGPPGWGLGVGPTTPSRKNYQVMETATMNPNPQGPMENSSQAPELSSMTALSENPSREAMSSRRSFLGPKSEMGLSWGEAGNCERQDTVEKRHCCGPMPHWGQQYTCQLLLR